MRALADAERIREFMQALSQDVGEMLRRGLVDPPRALQYFDEIEPELYRYPAVDPPAFRRAVEAALTRV